MRLPLTFAAVSLAAMLAGPAPAEARQVCGWYAIAFCSPTEGAAVTFMNKGWGQLIVTSYYSGLRPGFFCVASGPQSKTSAMQDRAAARRNGVSLSAYIKRACVDDSRLGD